MIYSINKLEIEIPKSYLKNKENKSLNNISEHNSDIHPIEQDKNLFVLNNSNFNDNSLDKLNNFSHSRNNIINVNINNEINANEQKIKNKINTKTFSDENISDQNDINEEEIKTTIIRKNINIYDNDDNGIDIDSNYNISSDRIVFNEPKSMNHIICDKIKEMFAYDKISNNSINFIYNLDKKPIIKRELIYSYNFKKVKNFKNLDKNTNIENDDSKSKENKEKKTFESKENDFNVGHILQLNSIKKIRPKNTNKYLPVNSNKKKNNDNNSNKIIKNKKKVKLNLINDKDRFDKNKSISENKTIFFKNKYRINKENESIIDTHYLLYSDIPLGVPQNIKDSYKLLKRKKHNTPDNRNIEYLRTFGDEFYSP